MKLKKTKLQILKDKLWLLANLGIIKSHFEEYLRLSQFPEVVSEKLTREKSLVYFDTIEEKITQHDLLRIFPIKYPEVLTAIFLKLKKTPGQIIEYQNLAWEVGVDQWIVSAFFTSSIK